MSLILPALIVLGVVLVLVLLVVSCGVSAAIEQKNP